MTTRKAKSPDAALEPLAEKWTREPKGSGAAQEKAGLDGLELLNLERCLVVDDETANLRFEVYDVSGIYAEMELKWGPTPRQQRIYTLRRDDLYELHGWLTEVLGLSE